MNAELKTVTYGGNTYEVATSPDGTVAVFVIKNLRRTGTAFRQLITSPPKIKRLVKLAMEGVE